MHPPCIPSPTQQGVSAELSRCPSGRMWSQSFEHLVPLDGVVWRGLDHAILLEGVHHLGVSFDIIEPHPASSSLFPICS